MANSHKLSSKALRNYLNQLLRLPRRTSMGAAIDTGERWMMLDMLQQAAASPHAAFFGFASPASKQGKSLKRTQNAAVLASLNRLDDQVVKIFEIKNYRKRALVLRNAFGLWKDAKKPANTLFLLTAKAQAGTIAASARCAAFRRLDRLSLGLAAYLEAHRTFPNRLSQLAPKFLPAIPDDLYTNKLFQYSTGPHGCTLRILGEFSPPLNPHEALPYGRPITVHLFLPPGEK